VASNAKFCTNPDLINYQTRQAVDFASLDPKTILDRFSPDTCLGSGDHPTVYQSSGCIEPVFIELADVLVESFKECSDLDGVIKVMKSVSPGLRTWFEDPVPDRPVIVSGKLELP
jgi:hypothetical protein